MSNPVITPVVEPMSKAQARMRRITVRGEELLAKVRELIHKGNVRRIIVINDQGNSILEIPLTAGVIGAIVAPVLVAIGAIAALAQDYTLLIEAHDTNGKAPPSMKSRPRRAAKPRTPTR